MKLLNLWISNLFSIGEANLPLEDIGLLLVTGHSKDEGHQNGSGKSSLTSKAITWGLFGAAPSGVRVDNVINRHTKGPGRAVIDLIGVDGKQYRIDRQRGPAHLKLLTPEDDLSHRDGRETQKLIDRILGRSLKTFAQCELFGQGRASNFPALTPLEQKAVLEGILPFAELDLWCERTKEYLEKASSAVAGYEGSLGGCRREAKALNEQLGLLDVSHAQWVRTTSEKRAKLIGKLKEERKKSASMTLEELEAQVEETLVNRGRGVSTRREWENRLLELRRGINSTDFTKGCPTCGQAISQTAMRRISENNNDVLMGMDEARSKIQAANVYYDYWDKKLTELESMRSSASISTSYQEQLDELPKQSPFQTQIENIMTKLVDLQDEEERTCGLLEETNKEITHLQFWREKFGKDLKLMFIERAAPYLQERANYHMQQLDNPQIHFEVSTTKELAKGEKHEIEIKISSDTGGIGFDSLSGGEQQLASFAFGLALSDLATTQSVGDSSFLVLDEPFSQLDPKNSEAVVNYLTGTLREQRSTILLVSNDDSLMSLVPNRVHVVKENGVSRIE